jgi:hypothetical protein
MVCLGVGHQHAFMRLEGDRGNLQVGLDPLALR